MVDGTVDASGKSGMDKINESMAKIGSMLGVQHSSSSDDSKKASLIAQGSPPPGVTSAESESPEKPLQRMNSAEGQVIAPPNKHNAEMPSDANSLKTDNTGLTTKPTVPGATKTAAGTAMANLAAGLDNAVYKMNKSFNKMAESAKNALEEGYEQATCKNDNSDLPARDEASTTTPITHYVSADKPIKKRLPANIPKWAYVAGIALLAIVVALGITMSIPGSRLNRWFTDINDDIAAAQDTNMTIAFIGNSYLYVNDVPRVMECISKGRIKQESVINTGAGFGSLLKQGNGMAQLWQTQGALDFWGTWDFKTMMQNYQIDVDDDYQLFDYGMCTVPQLLEGYDNYLSYMNQNGIYFDVGTNPCFEDEFYMTIVSHKYDDEPLYFDYIVMNDQTRRMASEDGRYDSLDALTQAYASLIKNSRAIPIIVDTHAFLFDEDAQVNEGYYEQMYGQDGYQEQEVEEEDMAEEEEYANDYGNYGGQNGNGQNGQYYQAKNMTQEEMEAMQQVDISQDIPAFQAAIYEGLFQYIDALKYFLPEKQTPRIARIGLAYLAIYDDNKNMYEKLFAEDGIHASQHGTYLFACVLYCTIYGHLPLQPHDEFDIRSVFFKSRSMFGNSTSPSMGDVSYLRYWARKVAVDGYIPKSMVMPTLYMASEDPVEAERHWWNQTVYCDELEEQQAEQGEQGDQDEDEQQEVECVEREQEADMDNYDG